MHSFCDDLTQIIPHALSGRTLRNATFSCLETAILLPIRREVVRFLFVCTVPRSSRHTFRNVCHSDRDARTRKARHRFAPRREEADRFHVEINFSSFSLLINITICDCFIFRRNTHARRLLVFLPNSSAHLKKQKRKKLNPY